MLGKIEGRRRGRQRMRWLEGHHWCNEHETWANSRRWWGTGRPGMLQSMGLQRDKTGQLNTTTTTSGSKSSSASEISRKLFFFFLIYGAFKNILNPTSQVVLVVKKLPVSVGDARDKGLIPGLGIFPGRGHDNPLQYSCLGNPMDRRVWWATVHSVAESDMTEVT